jgi:hypothetical protein
VLVHFVDRALLPERKSGPKRMLIVAVLAFLPLSLCVLVREAIRRRRPDRFEAARLNQLNQYLWSPLR